MTTPRFGLTSDLDNEVIDAVLAAFEIHDHQGGDRLGDPSGTPSTTVSALTGSLPGSSTYVYRYGLVDKFGFETAGSPEITQSTPAVVATPTLPVTSSDDGGKLSQGIYYVYLSTLAGTEETGLSQPAMVSLITGEGTIVTRTPTDAATGVTGWRVWRQGPGESAPTKIGVLGLNDLEFRDDGTVGADDCACDPANQPPAFNRTNSTNTITVALSEVDAALVNQTNSPITKWRLYRATTSGGFTNHSLLHQVVETDTTTGFLRTTWVDDGTEVLVAGAPSDVSRTLKPSVAIKAASSGGAGPLQVHGSGGTMWAVTTDLTGSLVTDPSGYLPVPQGYLYLTSPDATAWKIDVTSDGSLVTTSGAPTGTDSIYLAGGPSLATPDATLAYQLTVDNTGTLITTAVGVSHPAPAGVVAKPTPTPTPTPTPGGGTPGSVTIDGGWPYSPAEKGSLYFDRSDNYRAYVYDDFGWRTEGDFYDDLTFNDDAIDLRVTFEEVDPDDASRRFLTVHWASRRMEPLYGWFVATSLGSSGGAVPGTHRIGMEVSGATGTTVTLSLKAFDSQFSDTPVVGTVDYVLGSLL